MRETPINRRDFLKGVGLTGLALSLTSSSSALTFAQEAGSKETGTIAIDELVEIGKPIEDMYFRLVTHGGDDPFWAVFSQGVRDAVKETGCEADVDLVGSDKALQQQRFEEAVGMEPDGIALVINDDKIWDKPVREALKEGVPVIGVNNDDTEGSQGNARLLYVGQNEARAGKQVGRRLFEEGLKKGWDLSEAHVAMPVEVPGASYGVVRASGIKEAMKEYGITSSEIIDAGGLEMSTVESRERSYLLGHPETKFMIGLGGIVTDRLTSSLKGVGKSPGDVIAGGFDLTPGTLQGIEEGYVTATIDQQQYLQGYLSVYTLSLIRRFGLMPQVDTGGYLVDSKNEIELVRKLSPKHIR